MNYDFERAALLLDVVHKTLGLPSLTALNAAALAELNDMIAPPKPVVRSVSREVLEEVPEEAPEEEPEEEPHNGRRI